MPAEPKQRQICGRAQREAFPTSRAPKLSEELVGPGLVPRAPSPTSARRRGTQQWEERGLGSHNDLRRELHTAQPWCPDTGIAISTSSPMHCYAPRTCDATLRRHGPRITCTASRAHPSHDARSSDSPMSTYVTPQGAAAAPAMPRWARNSEARARLGAKRAKRGARRRAPPPLLCLLARAACRWIVGINCR